MARWNFYFQSCSAVSVSGATVDLPEGHGMVTIGDDVAIERVFYPSGQLNFDLLPGEVLRLERAGLANRHGTVRKDGR